MVPVLDYVEAANTPVTTTTSAAVNTSTIHLLILASNPSKVGAAPLLDDNTAVSMSVTFFSI